MAQALNGQNENYKQNILENNLENLFLFILFKIYFYLFYFSIDIIHIIHKQYNEKCIKKSDKKR